MNPLSFIFLVLLIVVIIGMMILFGQIIKIIFEKRIEVKGLDNKIEKIKENIINYCKNNNLEYNEELKKSSKVFSAISHSGFLGEPSAKYVEVMSGKKDGLIFYILHTKIEYPFAPDAKTIDLAGESKYITRCVLYRDDLQIPDFVLQMKSFTTGGKVSDFVCQMNNFEVVNFKEDSSFFKKIYLYGPNGESIKNFFNKEVRDAFVHNVSDNYYYESKDNYFIVNIFGLLDVNDRLKLLSNAVNIYSHFSDTR